MSTRAARTYLAARMGSYLIDRRIQVDKKTFAKYLTYFPAPYRIRPLVGTNPFLPAGVDLQIVRASFLSIVEVRRQKL